MNLNKMSQALCLAFQESYGSDGPFNVFISFDGGQEAATLSKTEIMVLSNNDFTIGIDMDRRVNIERRWIERLNGEERREKK